MVAAVIVRQRAMQRVRELFRVHPAVAVEGPRQCGKTTLAKALAAEAGDAHHFDLENTVDRRKLETPEQTLAPLRGLVVIDEAQRQPDIFPPLRVLLDRPGQPARFLLTGSASPELVRGLSETLAGRVGIMDLGGLDLGEVGAENQRRLWLRGGFPRSYLAADVAAAAAWRESFVRTFLERDLPQLGIRVPATTLRRFWTMLAHYHGQTWNGSELARSLGADQKTARHYLDILTGSFMLRLLPPWFENLKKRHVKAPKIYVRDSGLLHSLHDIGTEDDLLGHPKLGASWEGFAVEQILSGLPARPAYFWATHGGAELDLLVTVNGRRHGFEFKYADAPGTTKSMRIALADLTLSHLWVVYPGTDRYDLDEKITVLPAGSIPALCDELRGHRPT
jgi:predicted AAA+ superfamily ATPase